MYKPISCVRTGVQHGSSRFLSDKPPVKHWRCELTALSRVYNLYFVACNEEIYVYEPSFPRQGLGEPATILHVPATGVPVPSGIDLADPHSVTRLHVDYLGNFEILLATCDDGDVVGYRISDIYHAIASTRDPPKGNHEINAEYGIQCFEQQNVGASAWGLAVHREARLIAISANTHLVRVVAYGLSEPDESQNLHIASHGKKDFPFPRHQNRFITLRAENNIPFISFDNSGGDPTGRWLSSSSIDGLTHLWDLSNPEQPARIIAVGNCLGVFNQPTSVPEYCQCPNRSSVPHAAWAAMFINPLSCHPVTSLADACGPGVKSHGETVTYEPCFWDITDRKSLVIGTGTSAYAGDLSPDTSDDALSDDVEAEDNDANSQGSDQMSVESESEPGLQQNVTTNVVGFVGSAESNVPPHSAPMPHSEDSTSTEDNDEIQEPETAEYAPAGPPPPRPGPRGPTKKPYCTFYTMPYHLKNLAEMSSKESRPMIVVTKEEIYMFQRPLDSTAAYSLPILTMQNPLFPPQTSTSWIYPGNKSMYHRQCFSTQIPELGVFIVASPAGRAGIFSLTRTSPGSRDGTDLFGFRLDHLLPMEKAGENYIADDASDALLVGVAVGPVQGLLDPVEGDERESARDGGPRRWRLMMYYHDHTVISYELGKYAEKGEVGLDELVV